VVPRLCAPGLDLRGRRSPKVFELVFDVSVPKTWSRGPPLEIFFLSSVVLCGGSGGSLIQFVELDLPVGVKRLDLFNFGLVDDPCFVCDLVHEELVVRDADDRAVKVFHALGQSGHGLEVEVVCGLVQD
jgi:hypothetical protein